MDTFQIDLDPKSSDFPPLSSDILPHLASLSSYRDTANAQVTS